MREDGGVLLGNHTTAAVELLSAFQPCVSLTFPQIPPFHLLWQQWRKLLLHSRLNLKRQMVCYTEPSGRALLMFGKGMDSTLKNI